MFIQILQNKIDTYMPKTYKRVNYKPKSVFWDDDLQKCKILLLSVQDKYILCGRDIDKTEYNTLKKHTTQKLWKKISTNYKQNYKLN